MFDEHPNYPVKDLQADEEYDKPQYNGVSNTHPKYSNGTKEASGSIDGFTDEGLSLKAYLAYDAPDGDPIHKTPRGIGSDGPEKDPDVTHVDAEITSPLSGKVIIRHHSDGSTDRFICPKCAAYVAEKGGSHALDPIFFWGAGIYHHETQKTPEGTKGYLDRKAMGRFISPSITTQALPEKPSREVVGPLASQFWETEMTRVSHVSRETFLLAERGIVWRPDSSHAISG